MFSKIIEKILCKSKGYIELEEHVRSLNLAVRNLNDKVCNNYAETKDVVENIVELNKLKRR
jgi:hypothetical protein